MHLCNTILQGKINFTFLGRALGARGLEGAGSLRLAQVGWTVRGAANEFKYLEGILKLSRHMSHNHLSLRAGVGGHADSQ